MWSRPWRYGGFRFWFDAFSSREPVSTPDQVRGRLSLENALACSTRQQGASFTCSSASAVTRPGFLRRLRRLGACHVILVNPKPVAAQINDPQATQRNDLGSG